MDFTGLHTNKELSDSTIISASIREVLSLVHNQIYNFNPLSTRFNLLYRASRDGWKFEDFHCFCDNAGPNLVLVKGSNNEVFGGFTTKSWSSNKTGAVRDDRAFLFNLTKKKIFKVKDNKNAVTLAKDSGPYFSNNLRFYSSPMNKENG